MNNNKIVKKTLDKHSSLDNHQLPLLSSAKLEMSLACTVIQM